MLFVFERLCLWPFALCAAFRRSLVRRDSHDYYGQSAPRCPLLPKPVFLLPGGTMRFSGSYLITGMGSGWLPNTFPQIGGLRTELLAISRCLSLPMGHSGFTSHRHSLVYSSPGIIDRVCQPWVGHVSPSPVTG
jgi:hypothetical protein